MCILPGYARALDPVKYILAPGKTQPFSDSWESLDHVAWAEAMPGLMMNAAERHYVYRCVIAARFHGSYMMSVARCRQAAQARQRAYHYKEVWICYPHEAGICQRWAMSKDKSLMLHSYTSDCVCI